MPVDATPVVHPRNTPTSEFDTPGFEERWAAWRARGAAHDRAVRRTMMIVLPIVMVVAAIVSFLLLL